MSQSVISTVLLAIISSLIVLILLLNPLSNVVNDTISEVDLPDNIEDEIGRIIENPDEDPSDIPKNETKDELKNNKPAAEGEINIEGIGKFRFKPQEITTIRSDIFKPGFFSLFDILVYLDSTNAIDLEYHFDELMNTHVIDSINGTKNWWYMAYYSGGWFENNAFRMDHYPYKDETTIKVYVEDPSVIERIHRIFSEEIIRIEKNNGKLILQKVIISGPTTELTFTDVEVSAHNLRSDMFQDGVITGIDVIMSLGDYGKIDYELKWYETIAFADPVKNYWIHRINDDEAYDTCGWVYEAGAFEMGWRNHIHIPSDSRVLNSPEYEEWFWICL